MTNRLTPLPFPPMSHGPVPHEDAVTGFHPLTAEQLCSVRSGTMFSAHHENGRLGVFLVAWPGEGPWHVVGYDPDGTQYSLTPDELTDERLQGWVFRPGWCGRTPRNAPPKYSI